MPVAVGAPHQAEIDPGRSGQARQDLGRLQTQRIGPGCRTAIPIAADKRDRKAGFQELRDERDAVAIGAADEQNVMARCADAALPVREKARRHSRTANNAHRHTPIFRKHSRFAERVVNTASYSGRARKCQDARIALFQGSSVE